MVTAENVKSMDINSCINVHNVVLGTFISLPQMRVRVQICLGFKLQPMKQTTLIIVFVHIAGLILILSILFLSN